MRQSVRLVATRARAGLAGVLAPRLSFVVVSPMRSGSNLLVTLLDSHPSITCESEILRRRHPHVDVDTFLDNRRARAAMHRSHAFGFKLQAADPVSMRDPTDSSGHADLGNRANAAQVVDDLSAQGWRLVTLERRDRLLQALSWMYALNQYVWDSWEHDDHRYRRMQIDPTQLIEALEVVDRATTFGRELVRGRDSISLVYEDDLRDTAARQHTIDRICDGFGLPHAPVSTPHRRVAPLGLAERVTNLDEVMDAVRRSRFAELIRSD